MVLDLAEKQLSGLDVVTEGRLNVNYSKVTTW